MVIVPTVPAPAGLTSEFCKFTLPLMSVAKLLAAGDKDAADDRIAVAAVEEETSAIAPAATTSPPPVPRLPAKVPAETVVKRYKCSGRKASWTGLLTVSEIGPAIVPA